MLFELQNIHTHLDILIAFPPLSTPENKSYGSAIPEILWNIFLLNEFKDDLDHVLYSV